MRLILSGFGTVAKAFITLLHEKEGYLAQKNILIFILGITDSHGGVIHPNLKTIIHNPERYDNLQDVSGYQKNLTTVDLCKDQAADILVECTPTNLDDGDPAYSHFIAALNHGKSIVTASKSPLLFGYSELNILARSKNLEIKFSAATAAALPAYDLAHYCLAGAQITRLEGILNGTTNFILERMEKFGEPYLQSLALAQTLGIAETNPELDVEGWDSAIKLLILVQSLTQCSVRLEDVDVSGITTLKPSDFAHASKNNKTLKLIARGELTDLTNPELSVRVEELEQDHPLAHVNGTEKGISYITDTMGQVTVTGGKSSPRGAAAAILKDLLNIAEKH